jgi:hypothetical protein
MDCPGILAHGLEFHRADRVCALCGPASLGYEKHLVFECPHLQHIRDQYASLFHCSTMKQFLWQDDIVSVAKFVSEGFEIYARR